jgi:hypothetical protein
MLLEHWRRFGPNHGFDEFIELTAGNFLKEMDLEYARRRLEAAYALKSAGDHR